MEMMIQMPPDFSLPDFTTVANRLEAAALLTPGYVLPEVGMYALEHYLYEQNVDESEFWVMPDRNLTSRMVQLSCGQPLTAERQGAADLMAFSMYLDINFDPSISFHELGFPDGNAIAADELARFRVANNCRPKDWMDLALGRIVQLPVPDLNIEPVIHDLSKPLQRWRRNYIATLKIGTLELLPGKPIDKVLNLMDWMFRDFILAGPAILFAALYFAPNSPRKRMLKQLRSPNRELALAGAKNSAWDITYLSEFVRQVQEAGESTKRLIFATSDRALAQIAPMLFHYGDERDQAALLSRRLSAWWPTADAAQIASAFADYLDRLEERDRMSHQDVTADFIDGLTTQFEEQLKAWAP